ncbi:MAG: tRNA isopentenyl-2-thiomethyl-A-37 hydroxylase MiaE, partial [Planctomycetota bacterium]
RFRALADYVEDQELARFYHGLYASEARHHTTYTRLAKHFAPAEEVEQRLAELAAQEAIIIGEGEAAPRMHS